MAKPRAQLALRVTTPDGFEITALVTVRPKRLPKFHPPIFDTTAEPAPESKPALRLVRGSK